VGSFSGPGPASFARVKRDLAWGHNPFSQQDGFFLWGGKGGGGGGWGGGGGGVGGQQGMEKSFCCG